jgi:hypothetical protein
MTAFCRQYFVRTKSLDQVIFHIDLLTDWQEQVSILSKLTFKNCLLVKSNMNWGVTCLSDGEMIAEIECNTNDNYILDSLH